MNNRPDRVWVRIRVRVGIRFSVRFRVRVRTGLGWTQCIPKSPPPPPPYSLTKRTRVDVM